MFVFLLQKMESFRLLQTGTFMTTFSSVALSLNGIQLQGTRLSP